MRIYPYKTALHKWTILAENARFRSYILNETWPIRKAKIFKDKLGYMTPALKALCKKKQKREGVLVGGGILSTANVKKKPL